jgi:hypothetical protein
MAAAVDASATANKGEDNAKIAFPSLASKFLVK